MISETDKTAIQRLAAQHGAKRILLFGSSTDPVREGRDIDLAVEGMRADRFFKFYGDLLFALPRPVDLIDLAQDTPFTRIVRREGVPIYG